MAESKALLDAKLRRAVGLHQARRLAEAESAYREILAFRPDLAEIQVNCALAQLGQGKYGEAEQSLKRAVAAQPGLVKAHSYLGTALCFQQRYRDAVGAFRQAIKLKPDYVEAYNDLGNALMLVEETEQAASAYRKAIELKPDFAQAHNNLGLVYLRQESLAEARAALERAIALAPGYADAHANLGNALRRLGQAEQATKALEAAIRLAPNHADAQLSLSAHFFDLEKFPEAETAAHQVIRLAPALAEARNALGNALRGQGKLAQAVDQYREAIRLSPAYAEAYKHLAMVLEEMGRLDEAFAFFQRHAELAFGAKAHSAPPPAIMPGNGGPPIQAIFHEALKRHQAGELAKAEILYRQVLAAQPDITGTGSGFGYTQAHNNLGYLLLQQERLVEAETALREALAIKSDYAQALCNLAAVLGKQERLEEAAACCRKAIEIEPNHAEAHNNLGFILQKQGYLQESEVHFRKAVALRPEFLEAHQHLGVLLCESDRLEEGFQAFANAAKLKPPANAGSIKPHQQRHDEEQQAWLESQGGGSHLENGGRIAGAAVNSGNRIEEISRTWRTAQPQIVVIDNLLTDEALKKLRRYCLDSAVWRKAYDGGYLGAFPEHGFAPPLLAQIAEELRAVYPAIIQDFPLLHFWAFKYDSSLRGIKKHADFAAVNVNFWITPDEANLDPDHGGLVVWDVAAPLDWNFAKYNAAEQDILSFLAREKAKPVTIPYRANRAVIFDSDLFHETDVIRFKPGYENRRINVTLLFGRRQTQRRTGLD